jgi:hypothetical protein
MNNYIPSRASVVDLAVQFQHIPEIVKHITELTYSFLFPTDSLERQKAMDGFFSRDPKFQWRGVNVSDGHIHLDVYHFCPEDMRHVSRWVYVGDVPPSLADRDIKQGYYQFSFSR